MRRLFPGRGDHRSTRLSHRPCPSHLAVFRAASAVKGLRAPTGRSHFGGRGLAASRDEPRGFPRWAMYARYRATRSWTKHCTAHRCRGRAAGDGARSCALRLARGAHPSSPCGRAGPGSLPRRFGPLRHDARSHRPAASGSTRVLRSGGPEREHRSSLAPCAARSRSRRARARSRSRWSGASVRCSRSSDRARRVGARCGAPSRLSEWSALSREPRVRPRGSPSSVVSRAGRIARRTAFAAVDSRARVHRSPSRWRRIAATPCSCGRRQRLPLPSALQAIDGHDRSRVRHPLSRAACPRAPHRGKANDE